jgi:DNA-binding transcriptional regulator YdaS (Cro superfamily)
MNKADFKRLRTKVGTQARVAGLMGVHVGTVIMWESGTRAIPPARAEEIRRLADNPPPERPAVDPMRSVSIEAKGESYHIVVTSSSGDLRTYTVPATAPVRITDDAVEITPAKRKVKK